MDPSLYSKKINLRISDGDSPVSASALGKSLVSLQNIIYEIGDHVTGGAPRQSGDFPNKVKTDFELIIDDLRKGSAIASLQIRNSQQALPGYPSYADKTIDLSMNLFYRISEGADSSDDLICEIDNEIRLKKILNNISSMCACAKTDDSIQISAADRSFSLGLSTKNQIDPIISELTEKESDEIQHHFGRIISVRVDSRKMILDSEDGKRRFTYEKDIENSVVGNLRKFVAVSSEKNIIKEEPVSKTDVEITSFSHINLKLIQNIPVRVSFEDDEYFVESDQFELYAYDKSYSTAVERFEEQFYSLWEEYVLEDESALHESAFAVRNLLKKYAEDI